MRSVQNSRLSDLLISLTAFVMVMGPTSPAVASEVSDAMLVEFRRDATRSFTMEAGEASWYRDAEGRSCTSCHTDSVFVAGRHERTGKVIEPMAPSVNPDRLTDRKKINKWFLRNCKWTFGRECTAQEKGDILLWLSQQ